MSHPEMSVEAICVLFGKTRQAYYQRLNYKYEEYAEESIVLDLIAELRAEMGRMGGRKLWHEINAANPGLISRDRLFDILDKYHLKAHEKKRRQDDLERELAKDVSQSRKGTCTDSCQPGVR